MNPQIGPDFRRLGFRWLKIWFVIYVAYAGHSLWTLHNSPAVLIGMLVLLYLPLTFAIVKLGLAYSKLLDLWDQEDRERAQEAQDDRTIKRGQAQAIEDREAAEQARTRADLEALRQELDGDPQHPHR